MPHTGRGCLTAGHPAQRGPQAQGQVAQPLSAVGSTSYLRASSDENSCEANERSLSRLAVPDREAALRKYRAHAGYYDARYRLLTQESRRRNITRLA